MGFTKKGALGRGVCAGFAKPSSCFRQETCIEQANRSTRGLLTGGSNCTVLFKDFGSFRFAYRINCDHGIGFFGKKLLAPQM